MSQGRNGTSRSLSLRLATVGQVSEAYPFSQAALRMLVFRAEANGLDRALIRLGRRVLIDLDAFEQWLESHRERPAESGA